VGTIKSRNELVQQLAEAAPALVVSAQAVSLLWLIIQFEGDRGREFGERAVSAFRSDFVHFVEAFDHLAIDVGMPALSILRREGCEIDRLLRSGSRPGPGQGFSPADWNGLASDVAIEVAALLGSEPAGGHRRGARPTIAEDELRAFQVAIQQREEGALQTLSEKVHDLFDTTHRLYLLGWRTPHSGPPRTWPHPKHAPFAVLVRAVQGAIDQLPRRLAAVVHPARPLVEIVPGYECRSACLELLGLAERTLACLEGGRLPSKVPGTLGAMFAKDATPRWWARLKALVSEEVALLQGRCVEPGVPSTFEAPQPLLHGEHQAVLNALREHSVPVAIRDLVLPTRLRPRFDAGTDAGRKRLLRVLTDLRDCESVVSVGRKWSLAPEPRRV